MKKDFRQRLSKLDKLREELRKEEKTMSKEIMSMLKTLMTDNPLLIAIQWRQGTPGYNDGEPCYFTTDGPYFKFDSSILPQENKKCSAIVDDPEEECHQCGESHEGHDSGFMDDYDVEEFFKKNIDILNHKDMTALKKAVKDAALVYNKLTDMEDQLVNMFDDGVEVT